MTLSKRLSRANRIATTEENLVAATLISVDVVQSEIINQQTGEVVETEQIEWIWEVPTAVENKTTNIHEWTGLTVNSEKTYYPENGTPTYNKLTTILIKTGLLDEKAIEDVDLENIDIESLVGQKFEFELERRNKKRGIKAAKLSTIKLVN
ncbi:MAG: hypothetical protein AAFS12_00210 [Cyanobacteria bacterium J06632_19]